MRGSLRAALASAVAVAGAAGINVSLVPAAERFAMETNRAAQSAVALGSALAERGAPAAQTSYGTGRPGRFHYRRNTGWTDARYRRHARKLRNQARNRRAQRG